MIYMALIFGAGAFVYSMSLMDKVGKLEKRVTELEEKLKEKNYMQNKEEMNELAQVIEDKPKEESTKTSSTEEEIKKMLDDRIC